MNTSVADRFWAKVQGGSVEECWQWLGAPFGPKGYGAFSDGTRQVRAHRWAYEALIAPIPDGLTIDHLCDNPPCVNPWHMEPVTNLVNNFRARKTHCPNGHEYTAETPDLGVGKSKGRRCQECRRAAAQRAVAKRRERLTAAA